MPELTNDMLDRPKSASAHKIVHCGRPSLGAQPKSAVTLRLDADVRESYRATGAVWQTRLNADLSKIRKLGAPTPARKVGVSDATGEIFSLISALGARSQMFQSVAGVLLGKTGLDWLYGDDSPGGFDRTLRRATPGCIRDI